MQLTAGIDEGEWRALARRITTDAHVVAETAVRKATKAADIKAKAGHWQDRTGLLRREIFPQIEGWSGDWFWGLVTSPTKYARYVEYPTRAHEIWPKASYGFKGPLRPSQSRRATGKGPHEHIVGRGVALRWVDASGEHFARMVHHPGTDGTYYMKDAAIVAQITLETEVRNGFAILTVH